MRAPQADDGPLKSLRGQAADLLRRQRYLPERAAEELTLGGVPTTDARRAVNDALETQFLREQGRARSAMLVGGLAAGVGLVLTLATMIASDAGAGVYFVFTGALIGGLAEFGRGVSLRPGRPPYLNE